MCLSCMHYLETCSDPVCASKADPQYDRYTNHKTGLDLYLWTGSNEPCQHIRAGHGEDCRIWTELDVLECNCDYKHVDESLQWVYGESVREIRTRLRKENKQ